VVVVDATPPGDTPGRVRVVHLDVDRRLQPGHAVDSHGLGVADVIELARVLGRLPSRLTLVGVEAQSSRLGAGLSTPVLEHVDDAVRAVLRILADPSRPS
jgi:hydrogenase maturation protease